MEIRVRRLVSPLGENKGYDMYKKMSLLCTLLFACTQYASDLTPWLEIKPSYFFFCTSPMKDIYSKGGFEIQGSASVPVCDYIDVYGSIGYRKVFGNALSTCEKTNLTIIPVDLGLKPVFNFCERFYYFFAVGPRYFHFHQRNHSPYVNCTVKSSGFGLFANTGFNVLLADHLLLGIFGEYSYENKKTCPNMLNVYSDGDTQLGGLAFGVSLGCVF